MKRLLFFVLIFILSISLVEAATVQGTIYDLSLNKANNVIVTVDSKPIQKIISPYGFYTFDLPLGEYNLRAEYYEDQVLISMAEEFVLIEQQGTFRVDLVLFSNLEDDTEVIELPETTLERESYWFYYVLALFIIGILFLRYRLIQVNNNKSIKNEQLKQEIKIVKVDTELNDLLNLIKQNNGRITQKEIRKHHPSMSEAKMSLMITELEHKGLVKKVKKGRGNVIFRR